MTFEKVLENAKSRLKMQTKAFEKQFSNAGYQVDIDTLTDIKAKVTEQKFYEVKVSDYLPILVGQHPYSSEILTYTSQYNSDGFEAGNIEAGAGGSRLSSTGIKINSVKTAVQDWAKSYSYTLMQLAKASKSGNWDLIEQIEKSRVKDWQLGIQKVAFLGLASNTSDFQGLLTQSTVTSNTTTITEDISGMTSTELETLIKNLIADYRSNANSSAYPTHFVMPADDYEGMATASNATYPLKSKLDRLREMFAQMTLNPDFKILPSIYAMEENNASFLNSGSGYNRYVLYRYDDASLSMEIPVDYTTTTVDTINGFTYNSVGYGEYTGAKAFRPKEMLYFDWAS